MSPAEDDIRRPAVAGSFYPADPTELRRLVGRCAGAAPAAPAQLASGADLLGVLVPHAGLEYSGRVAAAAWRLVEADRAVDAGPSTVVILGTNHRAGWLDGIGVWEAGAWRTPLGAAVVDAALATAILAMGRPFVIDRVAHADEHSIEVQLPLFLAARPEARIVPLTVATGTGDRAREAGARLGQVLAAERAHGSDVVLAISTDMAHYPPADVADAVTDALLAAILDLDAAALAATEHDVVAAGPRGLVCGMCGIEPAVVGLTALRVMGATRGVVLDRATSGDVGGPPDRTVGYLAAAFVA